MGEKIEHENEIIAIIVYAEFKRDGLEFFTPDQFSQQLAYMCHPPGKTIPPHTHREVQRQVFYTLETIFVRSGRVRVDFYAADTNYIASRELKSGDVVLLASGGHGFTMLEETEMIEVKQGPYAGEQDKVRFNGIIYE